MNRCSKVACNVSAKLFLVMKSTYKRVFSSSILYLWQTFQFEESFRFRVSNSYRWKSLFWVDIKSVPHKWNVEFWVEGYKNGMLSTHTLLSSSVFIWEIFHQFLNYKHMEQRILSQIHSSLNSIQFSLRKK